MLGAKDWQRGGFLRQGPGVFLSLEVPILLFATTLVTSGRSRTVKRTVRLRPHRPLPERSAFQWEVLASGIRLSEGRPSTRPPSMEGDRVGGTKAARKMSHKLTPREAGTVDTLWSSWETKLACDLPVGAHPPPLNSRHRLSPSMKEKDQGESLGVPLSLPPPEGGPARPSPLRFRRAEEWGPACPAAL